MPMNYPENIERDPDTRIMVRSRTCFCEVCARDHGEEVQAIALAPQSADGEYFRWLPVCECHLADWFLGCEDYPQAIRLEEPAPRIWIKPRG